MSNQQIFRKNNGEGPLCNIHWGQMAENEIEMHVFVFGCTNPLETLDRVIQPRLLITIYHLIDEAKVTLQCA